MAGLNLQLGISARKSLGTWRCPSGNTVDAYFEPGDDALRHLSFEWDSPPPLQPVDEVFYFAVILPAVTRSVLEYLEQPGRALVVQL